MTGRAHCQRQVAFFTFQGNMIMHDKSGQEMVLLFVGFLSWPDSCLNITNQNQGRGFHSNSDIHGSIKEWSFVTE